MPDRCANEILRFQANVLCRQLLTHLTVCYGRSSFAAAGPPAQLSAIVTPPVLIDSGGICTPTED